MSLVFIVYGGMLSGQLCFNIAVFHYSTWTLSDGMYKSGLWTVPNKIQFTFAFFSYVEGKAWVFVNKLREKKNHVWKQGVHVPLKITALCLSERNLHAAGQGTPDSVLLGPSVEPL